MIIRKKDEASGAFMATGEIQWSEDPAKLNNAVRRAVDKLLDGRR